jgi:hypothetical protein
MQQKSGLGFSKLDYQEKRGFVLFRLDVCEGGKTVWFRYEKRLFWV